MVFLQCFVMLGPAWQCFFCGIVIYRSKFRRMDSTCIVTQSRLMIKQWILGNNLWIATVLLLPLSDQASMRSKTKKYVGFTHAPSKVHNFPLQGWPNILLVNYDSCWQHQMLVRELRHDRPSGQFSKSRGLSARISFLSSSLPPRSFTCTIFSAVFYFHSSFFSPKLHGNTCYAGYTTSSNHRLMSTLQCVLAPGYLLCCQALFQSREPVIQVDHEFCFTK